MTRLAILDRDGVLNEDRADYVKSPDELVMIPGAAAAVALLNRAGVKVAVATNQSAVGRGIITPAMLDRIHERLEAELARAQARLDALYVCPDPPGVPSTCRKPHPGMLRAALDRFGAAPAETPMIGDTLRDLEAAAALGCPRHLVRTGQGEATLAAGLPAAVRPVTLHRDLAAAVAAILGTA